jgi:DNA/RNA endonuclease G (NUC1)
MFRLFSITDIWFAGLIPSEVLKASLDWPTRTSHHYTNSCPQVHSFNDMTWGDLEDWILSQERSRESKGSVLTGPIFQETDRVYEG